MSRRGSPAAEHPSLPRKWDQSGAFRSLTVSVTSIGVQAFKWCTNLTSITIPDSVTSIGEHAFEDCASLTAVIFLGNAPKAGQLVFLGTSSTIYRKPEAKGWGKTWGRRPVKLISEKP